MPILSNLEAASDQVGKDGLAGVLALRWTDPHLGFARGTAEKGPREDWGRRMDFKANRLREVVHYLTWRHRSRAARIPVRRSGQLQVGSFLVLPNARWPVVVVRYG
jgi:hypothetical protein